MIGLRCTTFQAAAYVSAIGSLKHHCSNQPNPNAHNQSPSRQPENEIRPILATLLAACGIAPQTARVQDFSALHVQVANTPDGSTLTLTGLLNDSALGIHHVRITSNRQQQTAHIIVYKTLANRQHTGQLNARFVLAHPVRSVLFGTEQQTIWTAD